MRRLALHRRVVICVHCLVGALALPIFAHDAHAEPAAQPDPAPARETLTLDNGVRVVLHPAPGAPTVAIAAVFESGGFMGDPRGMPQAAHLVEHLRYTGATASHAPGASAAAFNQGALANAETLLDFTYYDFVVPPGRVEPALDLIAERLESLRITDADIAREGPRAAAEVDFVVTAPGTPVGKFAQTALAQAWRFPGDRVQVRTGVDKMDRDALTHLEATTHTTGALTLHLAGGFEPDAVKAAIARTIARVEAQDAPRIVTPDLQALEPVTTVVWDTPVRVVSIACAAPDDPAARAALTFGAGFVAGSVRQTPGVVSVISSSPTAPVGVAPVHIAAALAPDADVDAVIERLHSALDSAATASGIVRFQVLNMPAAAPMPTLDAARAQAPQLARMRGLPEDLAIGGVYMGAILQQVTTSRALPPETRAALADITPAQLQERVRAATARELRRVVILEPDAPKPDPARTPAP